MRPRISRFVLLLVVYFAGFATAIYCLAPAEQNSEQAQRGFFHSVVKSDRFAKEFNAGMDRCIDYGRRASEELGRLIREHGDKKWDLISETKQEDS